MPMELLQQLAEGNIPTTLTEPEHIYNLRVLLTAGHVYATIPPPYFASDGRWHQEAATVHQITALGYTVLRYFGTPGRKHDPEPDEEP